MVSTEFFFKYIPGPDYAYLFQLEECIVYERLKVALTIDLLMNMNVSTDTPLALARHSLYCNFHFFELRRHLLWA
jgi:hypothetical protein